MTTRLATYGTLAPGRANHHQLAGLEGHWLRGIVRGKLVQRGWGADLSFPGLVLNTNGDAVAVDVLVSADLLDHWPHLDAFEGEGYRRASAQVQVSVDTVEACIYVLADNRQTLILDADHGSV